jgi:hypothetical protein
VAALAVGLSVPAQAQQTAAEQFAAQAKTLLQQCQSMRLAGRVRGFVGSTKCSNPGLAQLAETYHIADGDLVALFLARRLEIAERVDAGQLTEGQGQVAMVKAYQEAAQMQLARRQAVAATARARRAEAQAAQAQRWANVGQALQNLASIWGPQNYWVPQFPQPAVQQGFTCAVGRRPGTFSCN